MRGIQNAASEGAAPREKSRRGVWWGLAVVLTVLVLAALSWPRLFRPPELATAAVVIGTEERTYLAEGNVRSLRYQVGVASGARIHEVAVREGDAVRKGQVLARLSGDELETDVARARATVAAAVAAGERARRARDARARGIEAALALAESELRAAQAERTRVLQAATPEQIRQARALAEEALVAADQADREADRAERLAAAGALAKADAEAARARADAAREVWQARQAALDELATGATDADRAAAEANVEVARRALLAARASRAELDALESDVRAAAAQRAEAQAALARAQSLAAERVLRSPADGIVVRVAVEAGSVALPGSFVIATRDDLYVEAELPTEVAPLVRPGDRVEVSSPEFGSSPLAGTVERLTAEGEPKPETTVRSRIVRARIRVADAADRLIPGMDVDVQGSVVLPSALLVPNTALVHDRGADRVLVVEGEVGRWRTVKLGPIGTRSSSVLDGLREGDRVAVDPDPAFPEGGRFRVRP